MSKLADVQKKATELEAKLGGKLFLGGAKPSAEDVKAFEEMFGKGQVNLFRWIKNVASFTDAERKAWGAPFKAVAPPSTPAPAAPAKPAAAAAPAKAAAAPAKAAAAPAKAAPAPAKPAADDDDVDLFGEETEEEKAALAAKKAKDEEAKKAKKVVIAKSSILVDIKPWDDTTDMAEYATKLHAIEMDGLLWGDFKMVPVAFGLKKLQQLLVIEDDKISGDDLEELLTSGWAEEYVQSIDIVAWNKV